MLHLFHPALVHFSVAFLIAGGACEIAGVVAARDALVRWGSQLLLVGLGSLVLTIASGYLAANTVGLATEARPVLDAHERNGWILLALVLGSQFWKAWSGGRIEGRARAAYVVWLAAAVGMTVWSAWLGGRMVYGHGVGVLP